MVAKPHFNVDIRFVATALYLLRTIRTSSIYADCRSIRVGGMRAEMLEWRNTTPELKGNNRFGSDRERMSDFSFARRLWVEFDVLADALLFQAQLGL